MSKIDIKSKILRKYNIKEADLVGRGTEAEGKLYLYVLVYSVLSANFYSKDCSDDHYQWCVQNLNNEIYWMALQNNK